MECVLASGDGFVEEERAGGHCLWAQGKGQTEASGEEMGQGQFADPGLCHALS